LNFINYSLQSKLTHYLSAAASLLCFNILHLQYIMHFPGFVSRLTRVGSGTACPIFFHRCDVVPILPLSSVGLFDSFDKNVRCKREWKRETGNRGMVKNASLKNSGLVNVTPNYRTGKCGKSHIWKAKRCISHC